MHSNRNINKLYTGPSEEVLLTKLNRRYTNNIILGIPPAHDIDAVNPQSASDDAFFTSNADKG